jgi:dihydroneopterin aldolase
LREERENEHRLLVDVALDIDLADAAESDRLEDTVDYALLVGNIREALEDAQCRLLERAAGVVADVCLSDPRVERVTVGVRKFGSVSGLGSAEVKVTRS